MSAQLSPTRRIPCLELPPETEDLLIRRFGTADAVVKYMNGEKEEPNEKKEEPNEKKLNEWLKEENERLKGEIAQLRAENHVLRGDWAKLEPYKETLKQLKAPRQNYVTECVSWVEFLQNGEKINADTGTATACVVEDSLSALASTNATMDAEAERRTARTNEITINYKNVRKRVEEVESLPKGSRKATATEALLREYLKYMKMLEGGVLDGMVEGWNATQGGKQFFYAGPRARQSLERLTELVETQQRHESNTGEFVQNVQYILQLMQSKQETDARNEATAVVEKAEAIMVAFTDRISNYENALRRLLADKEGTRSSVATELQKLEEIDARGEKLTQRLNDLSQDVVGLTREVATVTTLKETMQSTYMRLCSKIEEPQGLCVRKRKRSEDNEQQPPPKQSFFAALSKALF